MKLYTWKDVERCLYKNINEWKNVIGNIEVYSQEIFIYIQNKGKKEQAQQVLKQILGNNFNLEEKKIILDLNGKYLDVFFEESEIMRKSSIIPLFSNILYHESAYYEKMTCEKLEDVPVIAFHSYKGGVGRTLSLLAFAKAWSSIMNDKKLLIVDSDIEAPGITWLLDNSDEAFSYLDLLEVIHNVDDIEEIIELVIGEIGTASLKIVTETVEVEHIVLPTYRYINQLLDMYSSPENIVEGYNKKYIIAEVLSKLGKKLGVSAVLVDLRAGISEFSAPILFDPRVKKYIVTSTSYQSIKGTELLLKQILKGFPLNENILLPEIFLSMVQRGFDSSEIISNLLSIYDKTETDVEKQWTDNLLTELAFASELVHLETLEQIMECLEGREYYKSIYALVKNNYFEDKVVDSKEFNREEVIKKIHILANSQITAEENIQFNVLLTQPINNLIKKFTNMVPNTVVLGAKGAGKTFLYRELLQDKYWEIFCYKMNGSNKKSETYLVPLFAPTNSGDISLILQEAICNINDDLEEDIFSPSIWLDDVDKVKKFIKQEHDDDEWKNFWKSLMIIKNEKINSLMEMDKYLQNKGKKVVFLVDGLEEIFKDTLSSKNEKNAIMALIQGVLNDLKVRCQNIGCIVFLRKDIARNVIDVNFEQFYSLYKSVELNWSKTEAQRLVIWLVNQAVEGFYEENIAIEKASMDIIDKYLVKLWGLKLGKVSSNEAYSSRWILAALSDFNGQLQARDIIRFLNYATEDNGRKSYDDRYIMPAEIRKAVPSCSIEKIDEIKQEISALKPILEKLADGTFEQKKLPFYSDTFNLSSVEEKIMKQEGYLKVDNDKYYLPEIIRHALSFKYEKGARPKVLSLLLS
ncbi:MAG: P-loop ATPase, Sll1717 family [bacterium]